VEKKGDVEDEFEDDIAGATETEEEEPNRTGRFGREAGSVLSQAFIVNRINNANP
jgi:hypothetical protein